MNCPHCGSEVSATADLCLECGMYIPPNCRKISVSSKTSRMMRGDSPIVPVNHL